MLTHEEAFTELTTAKNAFFNAILKFQQTYDPGAVDLEHWIEMLEWDCAIIRDELNKK